MSDWISSWLCAWLFFAAIALGALANLMVHALTGGRWGETIRPALASAAALIPILALLFVPILLGIDAIYPWSDAPTAYLNRPFFIARSVAYLVVWSALAVAFLRAERRASTHVRRVAAAGLMIYALTITLAAFDWIASLLPRWHASGFGLVVGLGQMLAGAAFGVFIATSNAGRVPTIEERQRFHDLGNILLMYVLTWAYLAYTQFLIIWSENLPREIAWYVPRVQGGWKALGGFLIAFHFALPLAILLSRAAKRSPGWLHGIAGMLLVAQVADAFWLVMPSVRPDGPPLRWSDLAAWALLGVACFLLWRRGFRRQRAVLSERAARA